MKFFLSAAFLFLFKSGFAQNTFPNTGNVGIGTTTPNALLHIENGNVLVNKDQIGALGGQMTVRNGYGNQNGSVRLNFDNGGATSWIEGKVTGANTNTGSALVFGVPSGASAGVERMRITANGYLGIGTNSPSAKLNVENGNVLINNDELSGLGGQLTLSNGYGNQNGAVRLNLNNGGAVSWIKGLVTGANTNFGSAIVFGVPSSTAEGLEVMRITGNGFLGLGTDNPREKLSVNGNIRTKEIKVETANWPDYVFDQDYKILGLQELDAYIKLNKHLPEMPSAVDAEQNGVGLGEMNKLLLKKVEELTLHVIEMSKEMKLQKQEIEILKKK